MFRTKNLLPALALVACGTLVATPALAVTATQDGVNVNVSYTQSGQTLSFRFQADFTGIVTGKWIGSYMDQIGLQFGDANNNGPTIVSYYTPTLTYTVGANSAGETTAQDVWTGFTDKAGGNAPCEAASLADAVCYQLNPGNIGQVGDQIIGAAVYDWYFDVTFVNGTDIAAILASPRSIKMQAFQFNGTVNKKCNGTMADADCWKNGGQFSQSGTFTENDDPDCSPNDPRCTVPEPGTLALLGLGLLGLGLSRRRLGK